MVIRNEKKCSFFLDVGGNPQMGENPYDQVGIENPVHMQGSDPRWDLNLPSISQRVMTRLI